MTITQLRHALEALEGKGHGALPVYHLEDTERQIEGIELVSDVPRPIALLY